MVKPSSFDASAIDRHRQRYYAFRLSVRQCVCVRAS